MERIELKKLWNELAREFGFSLWCAYHGHSLAVYERADELHEVCHLHTCVIDEATARFVAGVDAPLAARRFVSSVLARRPYKGRVKPGDANLVISELATNAVVHAGTPFTVSLRPDGSAVRISVRDWSPTRPLVRNAEPTDLSGRGLHLVAAIANDWGVEADPDGKTVWAGASVRLKPGGGPSADGRRRPTPSHRRMPACRSWPSRPAEFGRGITKNR